MTQSARRIAARVGYLAFAGIPISLGSGRFWQIYLAPGAGIPYAYRTVAISASDVLVFLTCAGWLAWRAGSGRPGDRPQGTRLLTFAFALIALAAATSFVAAYDRRLVLGVAVQLALLAVFFVAAGDLMRTFPRAPVIIGTAAAVFAQALLAGWQGITQTTAPAGSLFNGWTSELSAHQQGAAVVMLPMVGRWLRSYGSFPHPNILGGFLATTLVMLALQLDSRTRRLGLIALALGFIALLLTFSRSAWLALFLAGAMAVLILPDVRRILRGGRNRLIVAAACVVLTLVALVRVTSLGSLVEENSIQTRGFYESVASDVIARGTPVGAGNLVVAQQHLLGAAAAGSEPAHNVFVIALAELGPIGLIAWFCLIGSLLVAAWLRRAQPHDAVGPPVAAAVLSPLLLLDHYLWTQPTGRILLVWSVAIFMQRGTAQISQRAAQLPPASIGAVVSERLKSRVRDSSPAAPPSSAPVLSGDFRQR